MRDRRCRQRRIRPIVALLEERTLLTQTVTTLAVSAESLTYGQTEVFTATVTTDPPGGTTPTGGTVGFMDGSTTLGTESLTNGTATFATTALHVGPNVVTASYSGNGPFGSSVTGPVVPKIATAVIMDSEPGSLPNAVAEDSNGDILISTRSGFFTGILESKAGAVSVFEAPSWMYNPTGVAVYLGNAYIAADGEIYQVNIATKQLATFAGGGTNRSPTYSGPATNALINAEGVAVDSHGNVFIADQSSNVIREVSAATGEISTVAGNGTAGESGDGAAATSAELSGPAAVAVDAQGNIFIADSQTAVIREVSAATGDISTVAGGGTNSSPTYSGPATAAEFNDGAVGLGVAVDDSGSLYIADTGNNVVRAVNIATGQTTTLAGTGAPGYSGDGGPPAAAALNAPEAVAVDASGNLLIGDTWNSTIREVTFQPGAQTIQVSPSSSGTGTGTGTGTVPAATVQSASIQTIKTGKHKTVEAIVLQFSESLDPADAQNIGDYGLVTVPRSAKQKRKPVALAKASYRPSTFTVTLTLRKSLALSARLELTVKAAGVLDALGRPLDDGANFVAILGRT